MLLQTDEILEDLIVKCLAHRAQVSAVWIKENVRARYGQTFTTQAIYKGLSKLQAEGVVVRLKKHYSLTLSWSMRFVTLADMIHEVYLAKSPLNLLLSEKVTKKAWRCSDFSKVANLWLQTRLALLRHTGESSFFEWQPHPWLDLLQGEMHRQYLQTLASCRYSGHVIVGGTEKIDRAIVKRWGSRVITASFDKETFRDMPSQYLSVVGDFIFSVEVAPVHHNALTRLCREVSMSGDISLVEPFFKKKAKFAVKLEENSRKAKSLTKRFRDYFGLTKG
jgi:hypothetical protein